jgi:hypothetical protein
MPSYLPFEFMRAVELLAFWTLLCFAPDIGAQQHANCYADGQPDADVSSDYTENRAQQCSQRDAQSVEFRFVRHNRAPENFGFRLPLSGLRRVGIADAESRTPEAI